MELTAGIMPGSAPSVPEFEEHALDSLQFREEIQRLITVPPENASSFTALLELPPTKAVELLHHSPETEGSTTPANPLQIPFLHPLNSNLKFPTNPALIERASKFSLFAADYSSKTNTVLLNSSANLEKVKYEPVETDSNPNSASQPLGYDPTVELKNGKSSTKRKEREKKAKGSSSKKRNSEISEDPDKLPYVHVRARRGQATDSHSLAERARREKINARMKHLQELVPGCNKISGTALVLDEIINHVHSLQREVEFLSMKVAAVKPKIDFNLDGIFAPENGCLMESNFTNMVMPMMWPDASVIGNGQQYQQQWPIDVSHQPFMGREEHSSITPENSFLSYDSSANSVSLHSSQLKMEL